MKYLCRFDQQKYFDEIKYKWMIQTTTSNKNGSIAYHCKCPKCDKPRATFYVTEQRNTFVLCCADRQHCKFVMNLHQLINAYGEEDLKRRYLEETARKAGNSYHIRNVPPKNGGRPKGSKNKKGNDNEVKVFSDDTDKKYIRVDGIRGKWIKDCL